ncbi:MAG: hypothetical protein CL473_01520 [Acidobacteria bacterium]|nr:hypothetical protein [Acidobacteriota bacterium]
MTIFERDILVARSPGPGRALKSVLRMASSRAKLRRTSPQASPRRLIGWDRFGAERAKQIAGARASRGRGAAGTRQLRDHQRRLAARVHRIERRAVVDQETHERVRLDPGGAVEGGVAGLVHRVDVGAELECQGDRFQGTSLGYQRLGEVAAQPGGQHQRGRPVVGGQPGVRTTVHQRTHDVDVTGHGS